MGEIEKRENTDWGKNRDRQKRFGRERMMTTGANGITPSRYHVVSHEGEESPMERVRDAETRHDRPIEVELGRRD